MSANGRLDAIVTEYYDGDPVAADLLLVMGDTARPQAEREDASNRLLVIERERATRERARSPRLVRSDPDVWEVSREKAEDVSARAGKGKCAHVLDTRAVCSSCGLAFGLEINGLHDAIVVAARGRAIAESGVEYVVDDLVPAYGMLGVLVAFAKVGKTSFSQALGAAVSRGADFIGRKTRRARVLYIAAEDPPEYTDWLARHIATEPDAMTFYERPIVLNDDGLARIVATVEHGDYGLVLIASWQAVVQGLVRDENDNAGAVTVVERVKAATRETKVPWLIDAHSGKGEDQDDAADPSRAQRGASATPAAADYTLWLRYAEGAFSNNRRLSGKGRFVLVPPTVLSYDPETGAYGCLGATKDASRETTWRLLVEMGALTPTPQSIDAIARAAGMATARVSGGTRTKIRAALQGREGVTRTDSTYRGRKTSLYSYLTPVSQGLEQ